nr:MAG TPA: hypothetical protein [Caudoviricetes sp.]
MLIIRALLALLRTILEGICKMHHFGASFLLKRLDKFLGMVYN